MLNSAINPTRIFPITSEKHNWHRGVTGTTLSAITKRPKGLDKDPPKGIQQGHPVSYADLASASNTLTFVHKSGRSAHLPEVALDPSPPVFGFVTPGGSLNGTLIHDARLANELSRRGYAVHVWWALDRVEPSPFLSNIPQRWLFHGFRYQGSGWFKESGDRTGRFITATSPEWVRSAVIQRCPLALQRLMRGMLRQICGGVERDRRLLKSFARQLDRCRVTHVLPGLELFCPFVAAARKFCRSRVDYAVTFQSYDLFANYAIDIGLVDAYHRTLLKTVDESGRPTMTISRHFAERVEREIGLPLERQRIVPAGVSSPIALTVPQARDILEREFRRPLDPALPLLSFVGRRDTEKGIDLLLYAANVLRQRGIEFQLAVCGPTAFGNRYEQACRDIAHSLRLPVIWHGSLSGDRLAALYAVSRAIVYPSIHGEAFGIVAVESMSYGTPVIVPDHGGSAEPVRSQGLEGGLIFRAWDSGSLADQLQRIVTDDALWHKLSRGGRRIAAEEYSDSRMADRVLEHLGLASCDVPQAVRRAA